MPLNQNKRILIVGLGMSAPFLKNHTLVAFPSMMECYPALFLSSCSCPIRCQAGQDWSPASRPGKNIRVTRGKVGKRQKVGVKRYHNRERQWRGSAGWLAFVPAVHFRGRGGGLQRCERFQDLVAVTRAFRHDPRVARFPGPTTWPSICNSARPAMT